MADKKDTGGHGPGESDNTSDLTHNGYGTYNPATNPPKPNTSKTTAFERAQLGGPQQGGSIPDLSPEASMPEGLKRAGKGPLSRTRGRG